MEKEANSPATEPERFGLSAWGGFFTAGGRRGGGQGLRDGSCCMGLGFVKRGFGWGEESAQ